MLHRPAIAVANDQSGFALLAARQIDHDAQIEDALKAGQGIAHQQRLLLPVAPQKRRGG